MTDSYTTITRTSRAELKVQGSRFLAAVYPVASVEAADQLLDKVRREYHDATHHCFAYRLGVEGALVRSVDDGEPAGTAGKPILTAIEREGLMDVLVIVTRYFGGIKLGTGGLARAYAGAAREALSAAVKVTRHVTIRLTAEIPGEWIGQTIRAVSRCGGNVVETDYAAGTRMTVEIRLSKAADLEVYVRDQTSGRVVFRRLT
jgi:uncharacterized YigZ family protein